MTDINVTRDTIQNPYQEFTYTLAAGARQTVFAAHRYFRVMSQSGGTLQVRFGNSGADTSILGAGIGISHIEAIPEVTLYNGHATDSMTITLALAMGDIDDSRLSLTGTVGTQEIKAATLATVADVALTNGVATLLSALSSTRREIIITNPVANAVSIRIGDANVTATRGVELGVGEKIVLTTTAAVYAFVSSASKTAGVLTVSD